MKSNLELLIEKYLCTLRTIEQYKLDLNDRENRFASVPYCFELRRTQLHIEIANELCRLYNCSYDSIYEITYDVFSHLDIISENIYDENNMNNIVNRCEKELEQKIFNK